VLVGRLGQVEFLEDLGDVGFDGAFGDDQSGGDGPVGPAFGDQPEDLSLPLAEGGQGVLPAAPPHQARDDRGVDHRLPVHDPSQGVDDGGDVEDALLEQVADPFGCSWMRCRAQLGSTYWDRTRRGWRPRSRAAPLERLPTWPYACAMSSCTKRF
jgi:hypothetical protein